MIIILFIFRIQKYVIERVKTNNNTIIAEKSNNNIIIFINPTINNK